MSTFNILYRLYPYKSFLRDGITSVETLLNKLKVPVEKENFIETNVANLKTKIENIFTKPQTISTNELKTIDYIATDYQNKLISEMLQTSAVSDFCLIGPRGCGKNIVVNKLAEIVGTEIENIVLYQDITSRDLIQQRTTLDNGDTVWRNSPLINAALDGKIAVIDGIHRIHSSTLSVLHRLVHDREIQLHDGKRLINAERYDQLIKECDVNPDQLFASGVLRIHPDFRIIALAEPPVVNVKGNWLTSEMLSLFLFHEMRTLSKSEEINIIEAKVCILFNILLTK